MLKALADRLAEALAELDAMVGLEPVKQQVRAIAAQLRVARLREGQGLRAQAPMRHFVFVGPPGTAAVVDDHELHHLPHRHGRTLVGEAVFDGPAEPSRLPALEVVKALDKHRLRRYPTAKDFADDVRRYLDGEPVQACPPSVARNRTSLCSGAPARSRPS